MARRIRAEGRDEAAIAGLGTAQRTQVGRS